MKRRESGKSARHARRDGWRAPSQAMLKYCRHKARPTPAPPGARRALHPDDSSQSRRSRAAAEFCFQVQSGRLCREEQSGRVQAGAGPKLLEARPLYHINDNARLAGAERSTTIRVPSSRPAGNTASRYSSRRSARTSPLRPLCSAANELQDRQRFQKTRLARSNQPFSSAVNGLTAWLVVASGRAKAVGGGA
jgi:hypothetical protein